MQVFVKAIVLATFSVIPLPFVKQQRGITILSEQILQARMTVTENTRYIALSQMMSDPRSDSPVHIIIRPVILPTPAKSGLSSDLCRECEACEQAYSTRYLPRTAHSHNWIVEPEAVLRIVLLLQCSELL